VQKRHFPLQPEINFLVFYILTRIHIQLNEGKVAVVMKHHNDDFLIVDLTGVPEEETEATGSGYE
jgi:hypothetical protein